MAGSPPSRVACQELAAEPWEPTDNTSSDYPLGFERRCLRPELLSLGQLHRDLDSLLLGEVLGFVVAGVHVAGDADAGIVGQHALDALRHVVGAVGDGDLSGVLRVADAYASAVVDRNPRAPLAVLSSALSSGQSAMASLPSFMDSVSRKGEATEPQSR